MVLESHVKLCMTEPDFAGKFFLPPKLGKWAQNGPKMGHKQVFSFFRKIWSLIFTEFDL